MHADTLLFLDHLFNRCQTVPDSAMTLTAIHPDGHQRTPSRHIPFGDLDAIHNALEALAVANSQGWGAYVAVGLRRPGLTRWQRGGLSDVVVLPALFADIDDESDVVQERLMTSSLIPSLLVHSGGGYHAYWMLNEPTTDLALAVRILEGLATYYGGDSLSPATSLRLPGTHNTKPGRDGALCHLVHHMESRYCLSDFSPFIKRETSPLLVS
jgi:hypothetical protein